MTKRIVLYIFFLTVIKLSGQEPVLPDSPVMPAIAGVKDTIQRQASVLLPDTIISENRNVLDTLVIEPVDTLETKPPVLEAENQV